MAKWYYKMAGQEIGPFTGQQLKQLADEKRITPTDPVRRDTDTEWTIAKNVKGLFSEPTDIPMGTAIPVTPVKAVPPKAPIVTPVPPGADLPTGKAVVPPASAVPAKSKSAGKAVSGKSSKRTAGKVVSAFDEEEFSNPALNFDVAPASKPGAGKAAAKKAAKAAGGKAANAGKDAPEVEEGEGKVLTKKEKQKRNFIILTAVTLGIILLAVIILLFVSCGGSDKPADAEGTPAGEEVLSDAEAGTETDGETEDGAKEENADTDADGAEKEEADADAQDEDAEKSNLPQEWADAGYKTPCVDGKIQSCTFGNLQVYVMQIRNAKLMDYDPKSPIKNKEREYCFIKVKIENVNKDGKLLDVPGWGSKGTNGVKLFDEKNNSYRTQKVLVADQADSTMQIAEGESFTDVLVFNPPKLENTEYLRLELPPVQANEDPCKLFLPKELFLPKDKKAKDKKAEGEEGAEDGEEGAEEATEDGEENGTEDGAKDQDGKEDGDEKSDSDELESDEKSDSDPFDRDGKPAEGGLVEELEKTPPPADAEEDELESAEESLDIFNDPSLNQD